MSLSDELQAEASIPPLTQRSQIDLFLESLDEQDRADVEAWVMGGRNRRALWRVLQRRGLTIGESTLRNWASAKCR